MTAPDPPDSVDRGLVLRVVAGAAVIGLAVALVSAGLYLSIVSRDRGPSPPPTQVAVVSPTPIPSSGGTALPGSSGGSPSAGDSASPAGASPSPGGPSGSGSSPASAT